MENKVDQRKLIETNFDRFDEHGFDLYEYLLSGIFASPEIETTYYIGGCI